jgi:hypothetical protein
MKGPAHIGARRVLEPALDLFGHSSPPNHRAALENENLPSRLGEISGSHKTIVTRADDDDVVTIHP